MRSSEVILVHTLQTRAERIVPVRDDVSIPHTEQAGSRIILGCTFFSFSIVFLSQRRYSS